MKKTPTKPSRRRMLKGSVGALGSLGYLALGQTISLVPGEAQAATSFLM